MHLAEVIHLRLVFGGWLFSSWHDAHPQIRKGCCLCHQVPTMGEATHREQICILCSTQVNRRAQVTAILLVTTALSQRRLQQLVLAWWRWWRGRKLQLLNRELLPNVGCACLSAGKWMAAVMLERFWFLTAMDSKLCDSFCISYQPFYLAYSYFFHSKRPLKLAYFYKFKCCVSFFSLLCPLFLHCSNKL